MGRKINSIILPPYLVFFILAYQHVWRVLFCICIFLLLCLELYVNSGCSYKSILDIQRTLGFCIEIFIDRASKIIIGTAFWSSRSLIPLKLQTLLSSPWLSVSMNKLTETYHRIVCLRNDCLKRLQLTVLPLTLELFFHDSTAFYEP